MEAEIVTAGGRKPWRLKLYRRWLQTLEAEIVIVISGFVRSFVRRTANRTAFPHTIFGTGLVIGTDFVGTKCGCFWFGLVIGSDFVGTKCGCFGSAHPVNFGTDPMR